MKKTFLTIISAMILLMMINVSVTEASYTKVSSKTFYGLSKAVYNVKDSKTESQLKKQTYTFNKNLVALNYTNTDSQKNQPIYQVNNPKKTIAYDTNPYSGFKALTTVDKTKKQVIISFSGTDDFDDMTDALRLVGNSHSYQEIDALLYVKYIYSLYGSKYGKYEWYLTGHSLGGNLAVTTYLNLLQDKKFNARGSYPYTLNSKVKSKDIKISGVYVFNPLPISKAKLNNNTLWNNNVNKKYNKIIKSHVIQNEWLHIAQQIGKKDLAYFGTVQYEKNPLLKGTFKLTGTSKEKSNVIVRKTRLNSGFISDYVTINNGKFTKANLSSSNDAHALKNFEKLVK